MSQPVFVDASAIAVTSLPTTGILSKPAGNLGSLFLKGKVRVSIRRIRGVNFIGR